MTYAGDIINLAGGSHPASPLSPQESNSNHHRATTPSAHDSIVTAQVIGPIVIRRPRRINLNHVFRGGPLCSQLILDRGAQSHIPVPAPASNLMDIGCGTDDRTTRLRGLPVAE